MSADPQMMAQLLMQHGQQGGMPANNGQPQASGASNLLQQVLAMQQLKQRLGQAPQQTPAPGSPPGVMAPQIINSMGGGTNA